MANRVGRPSNPWIQVRYTESEIITILIALKKLPLVDRPTELITKIKFDISERKRLHKNYEKAKRRIFGS